jgi:predicted dienelactone hydrolase
MNLRNVVYYLVTSLAICTAVVAQEPNSQPSKQPEQLYTAYSHPDMLPELSYVKQNEVGVITTEVVNSANLDPFTQQSAPRSLMLEVWYPANVDDVGSAQASYKNETRTGINFSIQGQAFRDAQPNLLEAMPVVVLSHGYTGYRSIMFYLGEHLAANGYLVIGIDHTDSTNADVDFSSSPFSGFLSTLFNRARDQQFVLEYFADAGNINRIFESIGSASDSAANESLVSDAWSVSAAGVIGYSMGAFGAINTVGGCYDFGLPMVASFMQTEDLESAKPLQSLLNTCVAGQANNDKAKVDPRWQAMVSIAPWGGQHQVFSAESLENISVPSMYIAGDLDDISGYKGIVDIYQKTGARDKYMLTYLNARHNIAPHPAPASAWQSEIDFGHYYEPAWSSERLNDINRHFVLAMMDCHLKGKAEACSYLNLTKSSNQSSDNGEEVAPWKGFDHRFSTGMQWQQATTEPAQTVTQ